MATLPVVSPPPLWRNQVQFTKEDHMRMVNGEVAPHFWAAVEGCLVEFHQKQRCEAAEMVTTLWRRLPTAVDGDSSFADMIYHAEPWKIACSLANPDPAKQDLPIAGNQRDYQNLLLRNGLISG